MGRASAFWRRWRAGLMAEQDSRPKRKSESRGPEAQGTRHADGDSQAHAPGKQEQVRIIPAARGPAKAAGSKPPRQAVGPPPQPKAVKAADAAKPPPPLHKTNPASKKGGATTANLHAVKRRPPSRRHPRHLPSGARRSATSARHATLDRNEKTLYLVGALLVIGAVVVGGWLIWYSTHQSAEPPLQAQEQAQPGPLDSDPASAPASDAGDVAAETEPAGLSPAP